MSKVHLHFVPRSIEAKTIVWEAGERQGWNMETMLDIACDFINGEDLEKEFLSFVRRKIEEEIECDLDSNGGKT